MSKDIETETEDHNLAFSTSTADLGIVVKLHFTQAVESVGMKKHSYFIILVGKHIGNKKSRGKKDIPRNR